MEKKESFNILAPSVFKNLVCLFILLTFFVLLAKDAQAQIPQFRLARRAYRHLYEVMDKYHRSFDIYTDKDAGGNHYYPSGWYNGDQNMEFDNNWKDNPHSGISCIKVIWNGEAGSDGWKWNGIMWQEPENNWEGGSGYELQGATKLSFWARTDEPGLKIKFLVGYPDDSSGEVLIDEDGWVELYTEWTYYEINLVGKDLSDICGGFAFLFNDVNDPDPDGCTFYLDDIRYDKKCLGELRFLESFEPTGIPEETYFRNAAFIYDNALAMLAFMARGTRPDWRRAKILADSFLFCLENDRFYSDGRLRNAYQSGDIADHQTGKARLPGWWNGEQWLEDEFQVSSYCGNLAWVIIALTHYFEVKGGSSYLEGAQTLGNWIYDHCYDTRCRGGYTGGYKGWEPEPEKIGWKATEHNIDIYVAFIKLYEATGDLTWQNRAIHAQTFVESMWDEEEGHFWMGTLEDGCTINEDPIPLDVQTWGLMALGRDYARGIEWADKNCLVIVHKCPNFPVYPRFIGFDFNSDKDGVWFEGTAQMVIAFQFKGEDIKWRIFLRQLGKAQISAKNGNGKGIVAACHDGLTTGLDWVYFNKLHIGATCWAIFAARRYNPYWQIPSESPFP